MAAERTILYTFKTYDNKLLQLNYAVYSHPLAVKWFNLYKLSIRKKLKLNSLFINKTMNDVNVLMKSINTSLGFINKNYDKELPVFTNMDKLDNDILNYLHEEFEVYGDRIDEFVESGKWSQKLHDTFLSLNDDIHAIETAIHSQHDNFPNFSALVDFLPAGKHKKLTDEDKLFLADKLEWGGLYLGYNTLGKDYFTIFPEDDQEVIERDEVRIQERYSTETWLNFGNTAYHTAGERFYHWYKSLPKNLQKKVPINDPIALSLGRYKVGQLNIIDEFLDFHPIHNDWMVPATAEAYWKDDLPTIHSKWNLEKFSQVKKLVQIVLYENDIPILRYPEKI